MPVLDLPDGRLAYDVQGPDDGHLVVAVHGMGDSRATFRFLAPRLVAAGHRVVTVDARGHGESSTGWPSYAPHHIGDDVIALVRDLGGGPATVIGHSSGTASAIWAAAEAPDVIDGIVLEAPFVSPVQLGPVKKVLAWPVLHSPALFAKAFYPSLYKAGKPADLGAYTSAMRATLAEPGRMAAVRGVMGDKEPSLARIPEVRCPVLVVMGTADPDYRDATAEARLAERLFAPSAASVAVALLEGCGHYPHAELPEATAAAITEFLDRADA